MDIGRSGSFPRIPNPESRVSNSREGQKKNRGPSINRDLSRAAGKENRAKRRGGSGRRSCTRDERREGGFGTPSAGITGESVWERLFHRRQLSINDIARRSASMAAQVAAVAFGMLACAAVMGAGLILMLLWRASH